MSPCIGHCIGLLGVCSGEDESLNEDEYGSDVDAALSAHFGRSFGGIRSDGQLNLFRIFTTVKCFNKLS